MHIKVKISSILCVCCLMFLLASVSHSQPQNADASIVLEASLKLDFEPSRAHLVAGFDTGESLLVDAAVIPPQLMSGNIADALNEWWFAAPVRVPVGARRVVWFTIAEGSVSSPADSKPKSTRSNRVRSDTFSRPLATFEGGVEQLRSEVRALSAQNGSAEQGLKDLDKEVKNIRTQAEQIGNFGRIIDAQEQLESTEEQLTQIAAQTGSVEEFIRRAQTFTVPRAGATREQQLVKEIAATADAATAAERSELARRARTDREAREMMAALEAARSPEAQDPLYVEKLRAELTRLRTLQDSLAGSAADANSDAL